MIIRPEDIPGEAPLHLIGGKGAQLANLTRHQLPVPAWFCISTAVLEQFLRVNGINFPLGNQTGNETSTMRQRIMDAPLPSAIQSEIQAAIAALLQSSASGALSIRSSAVAEDSLTASHAGQFDTFLGVTEVATALQKVKECWASLWSEWAVMYRNQQAASGQVAMAVIVQEFIPADIAGVMFTANPVTQKRGECVIEASWGLGEMLVSGQVIPDQFVLHTGEKDTNAGDTAEFAVIASTLGSKREALFWNAQQKRLEKKPNFRRFQQNFVLDHAQLMRLARLGVELQARFGHPQDIEWAIYQNQIYILQARPITNLERP